MNYTDGWQQEDYTEPTSPSLRETDPWAVSSSDGEADDMGDYPSTGASVPSQSPTQDEHHDSIVNAQSIHRTEETDEEPTVEEIQLIEIGNTPLDEDSHDEESLGFDEPEPVVEYNSELSEPLHELHDSTEDLPKRLKVNDFIGSLEVATEMERTQIAELLEDLSNARLRWWLPWMRKQHWTGSILLLFLDFRLNCWEETPQWWESNFWYRSLDSWWNHSNSSTLTLESTYALIQARSTCSPDDVIDETWFRDWDDYSPWKLGVSSFAEFAVFRAELVQEEDWREILRLNSEYTGFEAESPQSYYYSAISKGDFERITALGSSHPYSYPFAVGLWFTVNDWHDASEWDDNLGL